MKDNFKKLTERYAWKAMSNYIKQRDNWTCITCGTYDKSSAMHAGHCIPATKKILKYDYRNVHAQCYNCNVMHHGSISKHKYMFRKLHGEKLFNFFTSIRNRTKKRSIVDFNSIKHYYEEKLKKIKGK